MGRLIGIEAELIKWGQERQNSLSWCLGSVTKPRDIGEGTNPEKKFNQ